VNDLDTVAALHRIGVPLGSSADDSASSDDTHEAGIRQSLSVTLSGRERRLIELIQLHRPALLKFVRRKLVSPEDAEDIVQEACIRMLRVRDLWRGEREARAVLYTIATNLARDEIRRRKSRCHGDHQPYETVELAAEQEQPEDIVDRTIALGIIARTLVRFPLRHREAFKLHTEEHMSYGAIAVQLGISPKTVMRDLSSVHELCVDQFVAGRACA
jgi:RNA polymerase sigma factor (sigma-70 family)